MNNIESYPLIETDSISIISLTGNYIYFSDHFNLDFENINNIMFSNGQVYLDTIVWANVIKNYTWEIGSPFTIKYVGESNLIVSDSLKIRSDSTLIYAINSTLQGKEIFEIYADSTHLFNKIFLKSCQDNRLLLVAAGYDMLNVPTSSIEAAFRTYIQPQNLSSMAFGIAQ